MKCCRRVALTCFCSSIDACCFHEHDAKTLYSTLSFYSVLGMSRAVKRKQKHQTRVREKIGKEVISQIRRILSFFDFPASSSFCLGIPFSFGYLTVHKRKKGGKGLREFYSFLAQVTYLAPFTYKSKKETRTQWNIKCGVTCSSLQ